MNSFLIVNYLFMIKSLYLREWIFLIPTYILEFAVGLNTVLNSLIFGLSFVLLKRHRLLSFKLLIVSFMLLFFFTGINLLFFTIYHNVQILIFFGLINFSILIPCLYWYTQSLLRHNYLLPKHFYLHFGPVLFLVANGIFFNKMVLKLGNWSVGISMFMVILQYTLYTYYSCRVFRKVKTEILESALQTKSQKLIFRWIVRLYFAVGVLVLTGMFSFLFFKVFFWFSIVYLLGIYYLGLLGYKYGVIRMDSSSFLVQNDCSSIFEKLIFLLENEKIYRQEDLTLKTISRKLGESSHKISKIVNQCSGVNFNNLVNNYRIEEVKIRLGNEEDKKYTISSIAYAAGFNSLTSFNYAFKKNTGKTPSSYRKENINKS